MRAIGALAVRFRYLVVAIWVVATVVVTLWAPPLSSVVDNRQSAFLPSDTPSVEAAELAAPFEPINGSTAEIVVASEDDPLSAGDLARMDALEVRVAALDEVSAVRPEGVATDDKAAIALVATPISPSSDEAEPLVDRIRSEISSTNFGAGVEAELTGELAIQVDTTASNADRNRLTALLVNAVVLVMLFLVFRSVLAPIITLLPAVLVLVVAGGTIGALANKGLFDVSPVTQALFTVLVIGAGTDYGLFLVLRMREEMGNGLDPKAAVVRSVERVGKSISSSAGTVIGALLALLLATFVMYRDLGPALALAVAIMLLAALTLLPALCAIAGRALFWPRRIEGPQQAGAWGRIAERIVARPKRALAGGVVLFGALALCAVGFTAGGFGGSTEDGPSGSGSAEGNALIEANFPAAATDPTTVVMRFDRPVFTELDQVARAQRELERSDVFASVTGPTSPTGRPIPAPVLTDLRAGLGDPADLPLVPPAGIAVTEALYEAFRASGRDISPDGRTVQFQTALVAGPAASTAALDAIPDVRAEVDRVGQSVGAADVGVAGIAAVSYDISDLSSDDLRTVLPVVLILIAVLLAIVLKSLIAPLYLVASVVLSYFAALGMAVIIFMWIGGADGLNFVLPFLMFVFLMALGSDYNILVMTRIREEATERPLREAVAAALRSTGGTVTSAGLVLAATFAVVGLTTPTTQVRQLGVAIALGILLDTFLVRTLLVPSTVSLLGRWNWWPSAMSRVESRTPEDASADTEAEAPAEA